MPAPPETVYLVVDIGCGFHESLLLPPRCENRQAVKQIDGVATVAAERPEIFVDLMAHTTGARWTILDGTYGAHRNLYISLRFTHNIWSCLLWPSVIVVVP